MLRQDAERIIAEYVKPVFGFALKRCSTCRNSREFELQYIFFSDRMFIIHCLMNLLNSGRPEEQRKSLSMILIENN